MSVVPGLIAVDEGEVGFICSFCKAQFLSPESLVSHFENNHSPNNFAVKPLVRLPSSSSSYSSSYFSSSYGRGDLVVEPVLSCIQRRQSFLNDAVPQFFAHALARQGVPSDVLKIIASYAGPPCSPYERYSNFRPPQDYSKGLWPAYRVTEAEERQFKYQQSSNLRRSLVLIGLHPVNPFGLELLDLGQSGEVDRLSRRLFHLMLVYAGDEREDDGDEEDLSDIDALAEVLSIGRAYPKLANEMFALAFKQLKDNGTRVLDVAKPRPMDVHNDLNSDTNSRGEGDPGWWFCEMMKLEQVMIFAMPDTGPLKYFQILYAICNTVLPTADFMPFVTRHLKSFANPLSGMNGLNPQSSPSDGGGGGDGGHVAGYYAISQYASCCLLSLSELERSLDRTGRPAIVLTRDHLAKLKCRPPVSTTVRLPGSDWMDPANRLRFNSQVHHVRPWQKSTTLLNLCLDAMGIKGIEAETCSLYVRVPDAVNAATPPPTAASDGDSDATPALPSGQKVEDARMFPFCIPSNFFLGDLALSKVGPLTVELRRKHFFGCASFEVLPVASIQRERNLPEQLPLDDAPETKEGIGFLFLQVLDDFHRGERPITLALSGVQLLEAWSKMLSDETVQALANSSEENYSVFVTNCGAVGDDEFPSARTCKICALVAAAAFLRMNSPSPIVANFEFAKFKEDVRGLGPRATLERCLDIVPPHIRTTKAKLWWLDNIEIFLSVLTELDLSEEELQDIVLSTLGVDDLFGGLWFFIKVEDCHIGLLKDQETVPEAVYFIVNPRGLHIVSSDRRKLLNSITFERILRWSGGITIITIDVDTNAKYVTTGGTETKYIKIAGKSTRACLLRIFMLETIHSLMSHQSRSFKGFMRSIK